jgi:hypothetical protein
MNKIIFQIGLLAFFASSVLFASDGLDLIGIVSRGFLVFVGVVLLAAGGLLVSSLFLVGKDDEKDKENEAPRPDRYHRSEPKPVNIEG